MRYWFVTQDPRVLDYKEHGVWVHQKFKNSNHSGREIETHDMVAIYEVGHNEEGTIRDGAKAVVALSKVTRKIHKGRKEGKFVKIADTVLIAKDEKGIPTSKVLNILEDKNIDKSLFGTYILKYSGKVWEISPEQFKKFDKYFASELDEDYQREVERATPQTPPRNAQKPRYANQQERVRLLTNPGIAKYCLSISEFKCEGDTSHATFISKITGKNYVEAHHLIPLKHQTEYEFALDNHANIIALCPNCHRLFHHATISEKQHCLRKLFNSERSSALRKMGIVARLEDLLGYYS